MSAGTAICVQGHGDRGGERIPARGAGRGLTWLLNGSHWVPGVSNEL